LLTTFSARLIRPRAPNTYNLIGDAASSGGLSDGVDNNKVGVDPLLGALLNNGGPTPTHELAATSPAMMQGIILQ